MSATCSPLLETFDRQPAALVRSDSGVSLRPRKTCPASRPRCLIAALASGIGALVALHGSPVGAEALHKLSGAQIRAKFAGMQLTDEVHYRLVYERDGTLRSVALGVKKRGKWVIDKDRLCLFLNEPDDGCYDVTLSDKSYTLTPQGLGSAMDGILQPISDRQE